MLTAFRCIAALLLSSAFALLTGCGVGTPATAAPGSMTLHVTGNVHGGQQPVAGAHVHVFQARYANTYGSQDLIGYNNPTQNFFSIDSLGSYVATDASGNFSITGDYLCSGSGPVYLLATQGNPGVATGTNNAALALLSVVADSCSSTLPPTLQININEISTVAGVYALSGYLSAPNALTYPGNAAIAPRGLTNAADTALALVNLPTGAVNATTAAGGIVPAAAITSLANSIAPCINSDGTGTACSTLFAASTSDGTSTGTKPTDTATALINIAHHPAANVGAIYTLASAAPPFVGGLTAQPNDWTLADGYTGTSTGLNSPGIPAVDANGNVWFASTVASNGTYYANALSPLGAHLTYAPLANQPTQVAIDPSGNAWFAQRGGGGVSKATLTSTATTDYRYNGTNTTDDGHQIAIDTSGNFYTADYTNGNLYVVNGTGMLIGSEVTSTNGFSGVALLSADKALAIVVGRTIYAYQTPLSSPKPVCNNSFATFCFNGGLAAPTALAVNSVANIWALNNNGTLSGFVSAGNSSPGSALTGSPFSGGGLNTTTLGTNQPYPWLAIDGANSIWISNYTGTVSAFSAAGASLSPASGLYGSTANCKGQGAAIDGSGNLWVSCDSATTPVLEYIGLATPVTTPLLPGNFGIKP